jgi:hypothetical protein
MKVWRNFAPIEEIGHGAGKKYFHPVKVKRLTSGDVRITEFDGDQWVVNATTGNYSAQHKRQSLGADPSMKASAQYTDDDGDEQYFFGRGYVQLTWWTNYINAGVALGRGLAFLLDPELVEERETAYQILATGMSTGGLFANGNRLPQFFHGAHTDYVGARKMVNPGAPQANKVEVAKIAERFETVLFASKAGGGS